MSIQDMRAKVKAKNVKLATIHNSLETLFAETWRNSNERYTTHRPLSHERVRERTLTETSRSVIAGISQ